MLWLFLIFGVGLSFIFYRYTAVANKQIFFASPLFVSAVGSLAVLILAIGIVNVVNIKPAAVESNHEGLHLEDTTAKTIIAKGPGFTYRMLTKLNDDLKFAEILQLRNTYRHLSETNVDSIATLGKFGLGVIALNDKKTDVAREHFLSIKNRDLPFLHFCLGKLLLQENKKADAALEYEKELQIRKGGNRIEAFLALVELHETEKNYDKLHALLKSDLANAHFPEKLARSTLLRIQDYGQYWSWIINIFTYRIHAVGFIAAFLISAMWLIYLSYLDIFRPERFLWLVVMFAGGMIFCPLLFFIVDHIKLGTAWTINGNFFNDLAYCIIMIGVPEEFVKMIPLLILAIFSKNLKEPIDYIIYGSAGALGFAFLENLIYFTEIKNGIIHGRAYLAVIGHMTFSAIVAYAFVVSLFKLKNKKSLWRNLPKAFLLAATIHGVYDVLLFHNQLFFFFVFFVLIVQFWTMMINNAMNNSLHFDYRTAPRAEGSRLFITIALTSVFALEYIYAGFSAGTAEGNEQLLSNMGFAGFLIIFFSSNLSSFDLIKGYWRSMSIFSKEKRGYGSRQELGPWFSWYFVNASRAHNYVGLPVRIFNEKFNRILADYLYGEHEGRIVSRVILYEDDTPDPYWFLVRMKTPVPLPNDLNDYLLVRLRYQEDSLLYEEYVEVFFKAIPDMELLRQERPMKEDFPFYGWAVMKFDSGKNEEVERRLEANIVRRIHESRGTGT
ncbi:MAG TPA: PrsW family glutamic-type intramembrane protease [Chryseolinea sp.]